eukprot:3700397-Pleurochrysis_carterae.AAC.1
MNPWASMQHLMTPHPAGFVLVLQQQGFTSAPPASVQALTAAETKRSEERKRLLTIEARIELDRAKVRYELMREDRD